MMLKFCFLKCKAFVLSEKVVTNGMRCGCGSKGEVWLCGEFGFELSLSWGVGLGIQTLVRVGDRMWGRGRCGIVWVAVGVWVKFEVGFRVEGREVATSYEMELRGGSRWGKEVCVQ